MRDIRARITQRHGIELSTSQIRELAARRLEAILDPRNVDAALLAQLRKAAGEASSRPSETEAPARAYAFEDSTIYESSRGVLTTIRRLLNPVLRLLFNPNPIVHALHTQAKLNVEQAAREQEREARQAEWNALHFELLRRVVTESAKLSLEVEALSLKVESLATRVDFADRRVRDLEALPHRGGRQAPSQEQGTPATSGVPSDGATGSSGQGAPEVQTSDGQRRRRRRRRGRRGGGLPDEGGPQGGDDVLATDDGDGGQAGDEAQDGNEVEAAATGTTGFGVQNLASEVSSTDAEQPSSAEPARVSSSPDPTAPSTGDPNT